MHRLAGLVALLALILLGISAYEQGTAGLDLVFVGAILAVTTWRSAGMSRFLQIFAAVFASEFLIFGAMLTLAERDLWPAVLDVILPPDSLPITVGVFGIIIHLISYIPGVAAIMRIADRYFDGMTRVSVKPWLLPAFSIREQILSRGFVAFLVLVNQAQVGISVRLSYFNRDWFNALEEKNGDLFWRLLYTVFLFWALIYIVSAIIEYVVQSQLMIRWRRWLTERYIADWLGEGSHYRLTLQGRIADNPDQRIADDVDMFINRTYNLSISLISTISSLVSFSIILWTISANFTIPGTDIAIPGFLFWVACLYSGIGTLITHLIGRRLIGLYFSQQKYEASFRFSLARLREYAEQVALLRGEATEQHLLMGRFGDVIGNFLSIVSVRKILMAFTAFYGQISPFIPYIVAAPFYFIGKIQLGILTQTASAFGRVEGSLSYFIDAYTSVADYFSVVRRLASFDSALESARNLGTMRPNIEHAAGSTSDLQVKALRLSLPDGRPIIEADLDFRNGESVLISGPSGSGKSTLLRALSGIWPFGTGLIALPEHVTVMLLPQRPYLPQGTLRAAIAYPAAADHYSDAAIHNALSNVGLPNLASALDDEALWAQRLSGGEQQRIAVARSLLAKPDWLFLDEATSALDEDSENRLYEAIRVGLPRSTLISIGHRSTLKAFHARAVRVEPLETGGFRAIALQ
jgi:putative ATP-binding cassette transporter